MLDDPNDPPPLSAVLHVGEHDIRLQLSEAWPAIGRTPYLIAALVVAWFMYLGTLPDVITSTGWVVGLFSSAAIGLAGLLWALRTRKTTRVLVLTTEELRVETRIGVTVMDQRTVPILQLKSAGVEWLGRPNQYALRLAAEGTELAFSDVFFDQITVEWMVRSIQRIKDEKRQLTRQLKVDRQRPKHINDMLIPGSMPK